MKNSPKKFLSAYFKGLAGLGYEAVEWIISGAIIGITVGILMLAFRVVLVKLTELSAPAFNNFYLTLLLPTVSLFCAGLIIYRMPVVGGKGVNFVIRAILNHRLIKIIALPFKFIATILTLCFGGSGGREGPALQMSIYVGDKISQLIKFKTIRREYIIISAISASFGSMFHAPLAGAVFGCEVLMLRGIKYNPLLTCMFSSLFAFLTSWIFIPEPLLKIPPELLHYNINVSHVPLFIIFALLISIVGPFYIAAFRLFQNSFHKIKIKIYYKTAIGGLLTGIVVWLVHIYTNGEYSVYGMSIDTLEKILKNSHQIPLTVLIAVMLGKMIATNFTVGSGASGGLVMPTLFFGACFGILFAKIIGLDAVMFGAAGMLGFFGAVTHVPLAMIFLAAELFHSSYLLPVAIVGIIGSWILSYHSLYPAVEKKGIN